MDRYVINKTKAWFYVAICRIFFTWDTIQIRCGMCLGCTEEFGITQNSWSFTFKICDSG